MSCPANKVVHMKLRLLLILSVLLFPAMTTIAGTALNNREGYSLRETYEGYLRAVKAHDYDAVISYFTQKEYLPFVNGAGEINLSYREYLKGQKAWLGDSSWTYESELKSFQEFKDTGVIIESIVLRYNKKGKESEYKVMATYVFREEDDMWRMVTDICTEIQ